MRRTTILVAILAFTPLTDATAQVQQPPVERGTRVRVTVLPRPCTDPYTRCTGRESRRHVGTFLAWKADSLVMESNGDTLAVPLDFVTTFEVRPVERSIGKAAVMGLVFGGMIGGLVGAAVGLDTERSFDGQKLQTFDCDHIFGGCRTRIVDTYKERKVVSLEAVAIGAGAGGLLGLMIGVATAANRWVAVSPGRLGLNVGRQRDGRFGFAASVRF